jgi:hypothetical protein
VKLLVAAFNLLLRSLIIVLAPAILYAQGVNLNQGADFRVKLLSEISSETSKTGDKITAEVISPQDFAQWYLEGQVRSAKSGKGKSELAFYFNQLAKADASQGIHVESTIQSVVNSQGKEGVDEEGDIVRKTNNLGKAALMTGAGALIGGLAGGGKGAAIGVGAGAASAIMFIEIQGTSATRVTFAPDSQFIVSVKKR